MPNFLSLTLAAWNGNHRSSKDSGLVMPGGCGFARSRA